MSEKAPQHRPEASHEAEHSRQHHEQLRRHVEHLEKSGEAGEAKQEETLEHARHDIAELAEQPHVAPETKPTHHAPPSAKDKAATYRHTLSSIRRELPTRRSRAFSKLIHQPTVEKASEITGKTIFRPSLTLGAALGALIGGSIVYLTAKRYGFPLSGSEFIALGAVGAIAGLAIEGIGHLLRRHKAKQL